MHSSLRSLLIRKRSQLALVIGNGINRYGRAKDTNSWHKLLLGIAAEHLPAPLKKVPKGISLTEFYDVLDLKANDGSESGTLQQEFCDRLADWEPFDHHRSIVGWAKANRVPILTTNFDEVLSGAGECSLRRTVKGAFTAYYPWESYFGVEDLRSPTDGFGIWHINGLQRYRQSIRLGLGHYMGSVGRARDWIHNGDEEKLYSGKNVRGWRGSKSWLHIIFNRSLMIFGLALEETEVFLRWLLLERARYYRRFPARRKEGWYLHPGDVMDPGKDFFLSGVGIKPKILDGYDEIYAQHVWGLAE